MIEFNCSCEKKIHKAPVDKYIIEENAVERLDEVIGKYKRIYMVCDKTTYNVLGKRVKTILEENDKLFSYVILPENPLPDYETIGNIVVHLTNPSSESDIFKFSQKPDLILAVGSGTVNDSCRLVSYRFGIEYGIIGTAPSMDGYLSAGSPILFDDSKNTIKCTTPRFLIADLNVLKNAPFDMLLAGIGDMFGKYTGILDWELARDYNNEYYCEKIARDVIDATNLCLENWYELENRSSECIRNIMEGFVVTGLGMAFTGNSRPASGSEHIVAHAWELEDVNDHKKPTLHGLEVCEATRFIAQMYLLLMEETKDEHLKGLIEKYVKYFEKIEEFCKRMNMYSPVKDKERIVKSVFKALKMRDRYTILFYLNDIGKLEDYASRAADKLLEIL